MKAKEREEHKDMRKLSQIKAWFVILFSNSTSAISCSVLKVNLLEENCEYILKSVHFEKHVQHCFCLNFLELSNLGSLYLIIFCFYLSPPPPLVFFLQLLLYFSCPATKIKEMSNKLNYYSRFPAIVFF